MPHFLYYLPGRGASAGDLAAVGLSRIFDDGPGQVCPQVRGPDGKLGILMTRDQTPGRCAYETAKQTWAESCNRSDPSDPLFWIGTWTGDPLPGPDDLISPAPGTSGMTFFPVPLGDGRRWRLPTLVRHDGDPVVPRIHRFSAARERMTSTPDPRFSAVVSGADALRCSMIREEPVSLRQACETVVQALRLQYRVGLDEANVLGLFTEEALQVAVWILTDRAHWPEPLAKGGREAD